MSVREQVRWKNGFNRVHKRESSSHEASEALQKHRRQLVRYLSMRKEVARQRPIQAARSTQSSWRAATEWRCCRWDTATTVGQAHDCGCWKHICGCWKHICGCWAREKACAHMHQSVTGRQPRREKAAREAIPKCCREQPCLSSDGEIQIARCGEEAGLRQLRV